MLQELYDKQVKTSIRECKGAMQNPTVYTPNVIDEEMRCIKKHLNEIDAEQRIQNSEIDTLKCGNFDNIKVADTLKVDKIESFSTGTVTFVDPVNIADLTVENFHIQCFCADDTKKFAGQDCDQWKDIINDSCVADACKFSGLSCTEWKDVIKTTCVDNAKNATCFDNKTYSEVCEDILSSIPPQPYSGEIDVYCGETCLCTINCENPLVLSENAFNEYAKINTETYPGAYCTGTVVESDIQDFITMNDVDECGYTTCVGTVTSINACLNGCSATAITDCGTLALDITPSVHFDSITRNICTCLGDKASNEITLPSGIFCTGTVSMAQSGENSNKPILLRNTQTVAVSSNCCPFTFNPRTGVLVAKCLCGKAQDSDCFNGCTYAEAKNDIRDGLVTNTELESCGYTTCTGTVTKVKIGTDEYTPAQGIVSLPAYPPDLSSCPGLNCTGDVTTSQLNAVSDRVDTIESYIPSQASCTNQLADKEFVNSSIETNTATFRGTFNSVADLEAYTGPKDNNDYAFVVTFNSATSSYQYDRYKYNGTSWVFEYTINTTGFTAEQLAALNSGITCTLVAKITDVYNCKICVQKNGTCIDSFTLNQSSNKSINITVPTKTSDITNDCSYTSCTGTVTGVTLNNCAFTGAGALSATIKPSLCYTSADRKLYTKLGNQTSSAVTLPAGINCTGTLVASDIADMATCTWVTNQGYTTCTGTVTGVSLNGSSFTVNNGIASLTNFKPATAGTADNSTCFNGCTYACAKADIRSGLCNHDCLVKLSLVCSDLNRNILFSAQQAGAICPVYASNGVPFTYNASNGNLRIGDFSCNCCNRVYIKCDSGLVRSGSKGSQTNGFVVYKENNCLDNCSIGVGIGSGNVNRGFFDYCKVSETATSPTFRWLQYWDAEKEIHALPIWGELGANNKVVYSCVAPLPSNTKRYVLVCFDKACTCNPSKSSAFFEIDIYTSRYNVWIDVGGSPSVAYMRTYWQTNGLDPNSAAYGSFCTALPDTTANGNCFWIAYGGYRAPVIKSSRKIYVICNTTTAPSGITFTAPTNRNSYTNVYCGTTCLCTLQGPANLCLGSLAFSSATIPTVNNSTIKIQKNSTDVGSFTLNQATGATIDISVPTKTSDITNDSNFITMAQVDACGYTTCKGTVTGVTLNGSSFTVGTNGIATLTNFKPATATLSDCSKTIKRNAIKIDADYPLALLAANTTIDNANINVSCNCPLTYNSCTGVLKSTKFTYNKGGDTSRNISQYQSKNYYGCRCTEMPICDFFKCLTACHNLASGENLTINYGWADACNNIICWGTSSSINLSGGSVQVFANNYNKNLFDDNCGGWYNLVLKVNPVTGEEYSFRAYKGSNSAATTTYIYNGFSVNSARRSDSSTNATCFNGCTYANAKTDIRSGLVTTTALASCGYTTCTGTVTGVSLNGSAFTVTNGVASLTGFKPATASLSDCADGVRRRFSDSSLPLLLAGGTAESCCGYTYIACTCPITYSGSNGLLTTRKLTLGLGENCTDAGMICAKGLCQTYPVICFLNNTSSTDGNGYKISGGGIGIIGAGEGSNYVWCSLNSNSTNLYGACVGKECLFLTSDSGIFFYTNTQTNNSACWKTSFIDTSGVYNGAVKGKLTGTASLVCRYAINTGVQQVLLGASCCAASGTCVRVSSKCLLTFDTDNGILSANKVNAINTDNWSSIYSGNTYNTGYYLLAQLTGSASAGNHDVTLYGTTFRNSAGTDNPTTFRVSVRGRCNAVNSTSFRVDNTYNDVFATYQITTDCKFIIRLYGCVPAYYTRYNTQITYAASGDVSTRISTHNNCVTFPNTHFDAIPTTETLITKNPLTMMNATCFAGVTYDSAKADIRSGLVTTTDLNSCGYTTCTGTVSSISLNGSAFTINNGAATLTGFKPATAALADCSTYVKRNVLANTTDAYYPLVLSNASTASNKASLYTPQASSVSYNAKQGTLKTYCFETQYIRSDNLDVGFAGQSTSVFVNSCYCALDNTIVVRDWTFCGKDGYLYGNVCGSLCGDAQNAKAISRNIAGANTTYDLLLTNGSSTADCTKVFVSSGGVNGTLKYDTGTQTLSVANISACCVCSPNLVTDNLAINCGVNFRKPICATGACICTSSYDCCLNKPFWPTINTDSSIKGKRWEYVNNGKCCTCVWRIAGVFGIQPMIICHKAKQCDVFAAIQDTGIIDVDKGSYGILGNAWNYCVSAYCRHHIDNIYLGIDDGYYLSFRTVNTERFRVYAECTSCVDWDADFISFNRYADIWF